MNNVDKVKIASRLRDFNNPQQKFLRALRARPLNNSKRDSRYAQSVAEDNRRSEQLAARHRQLSQALKKKREY